MVKVDLIQLIESEGTEMVDKGNHYQGVCPLHEDSNPSLVVYKNAPERFICFGCQARGDAIDFIRILKGWGFQRAVEYLDLKHQVSTKIAIKKSMIEIIVQEERNGVDVRAKYGKAFIDSLLAKELVKGVYGETD